MALDLIVIGLTVIFSAIVYDWWKYGPAK